eukprot:CAMPEP_0117508570 /NCGR_PEP_ID=MMETSP0784-20121206/27020_1 /TAXON_ID=39447 /ORGANISM="" /LENGTH=309 /DNA_ID=CAMNT_0005304135 /DNA_START=59 /DNA_END=988 /DNA_ORIENTATION=+
MCGRVSWPRHRNALSPACPLLLARPVGLAPNWVSCPATLRRHDVQNHKHSCAPRDKGGVDVVARHVFHPLPTMPCFAFALPAILVPEPLADGMWQSIALVGASELGDKTFFLSMIIAMRAGRSLAFAGSISALGILTAASVAIGQAFRHTPELLSVGFPFGDCLATGMFTVFGLQMLRDARLMSLGKAGGDAQREAEEAISQRAEKHCNNVPHYQLRWAALATAFSLVFVAEVGDKSMFATIALAREYSPVGVFVGSMVGHCLATGLAVAGGSVLTKYLSEAAIAYAGGCLFLVFAGATLHSILSGEEG